jgi:DNA-binding response OmpR family regulator
MNDGYPILLIDDDRVWLESLADFFRAQGFPVLTASSPRLGLRLARKSSPALVICDYNMPEMNGLEVVRRLRGERPARIILVSSEDDRSLSRRALAAGASSFLAKTVPPAALLAKIRQLLGELFAGDRGVHPADIWRRLLPPPSKAG